ncbi:MAG: class II aldolase/adducin family protein [Pseudonocardia sp.]
MILEQLREQVVRTCQALRRDGLVVGTAGNVSGRADDLVAISPSGVDYDELRPELVGVHRLDGTAVDAPLRPSTEFGLHLQVYHRTAVGGIVHTHARASTALSVVLDEVPASHYYSALFGGPVRVARYARFGSAELADNVATALRGRTAALMGNHGAITVGDTPDQAHRRAEYLEYVCEVQLAAMGTGLPVRVLPAAEIERVRELLDGYGQTAPAPNS